LEVKGEEKKIGKTGKDGKSENSRGERSANEFR
jgi:hypothetical protein